MDGFTESKTAQCHLHWKRQPHLTVTLIMSIIPMIGSRPANLIAKLQLLAFLFFFFIFSCYLFLSFSRSWEIVPNMFRSNGVQLTIKFYFQEIDFALIDICYLLNGERRGVGRRKRLCSSAPSERPQNRLLIAIGGCEYGFCAKINRLFYWFSSFPRCDLFLDLCGADSVCR